MCIISVIMKPQDLIGRWTLSRKIFDRNRKLIGEMWGKVLFEQLEKNKLFYQESVWNISGDFSQFLARQSYHYIFKEQALEIYRKAKGENVLFLKVPYGKQVVHANYFCNLDLYILRWVWINSYRFYTHFTVKGIRKNHILETMFQR